MSITIVISIVLIAVVIIAILLLSLTKSSPAKNKIDYKYQKRSLLTNNELKFYKSLFPIATKRGFILLTKVNLADLIEPRKGTDNTQASKNKISQKHADFVLCDNTKINPLLVIELDDASHDRADRQQRDKFVDDALESAGIPILHTRSADKLEELIMAKLSPKANTRK